MLLRIPRPLPLSHLTYIESVGNPPHHCLTKVELPTTANHMANRTPRYATSLPAC